MSSIHPAGAAPLPVPAPSQEFCITPNGSERQLFSSTFSSALNKKCVECKLHNEGSKPWRWHRLHRAALPSWGGFRVCFSCWQTYLHGTKPKFAKGSFQLRAGGDKKLVPNGNGPVWALRTNPEAMAGDTSTNTSTQEERAKEFLTNA